MGYPSVRRSLQCYFFIWQNLSYGNIRARFSYADDIGILRIGPTIVGSVAAAQKRMDSLADWAHKNAVLCDVEKLEEIQFRDANRISPLLSWSM